MTMRFSPPTGWHATIGVLLILSGWVVPTTSALAYHCEGDPIGIHEPIGLPLPLLLRRQTDDTWRNYNLSFEGGTEVLETGAGPVRAPTNGSLRTVSRADFDGDAEPDLLLRDVVGNAGERWVMVTLKGKRITSSGNVNGIKKGAAWELISTGDHNGDGRGDIMIRNSETGVWWLYLMNGAEVTDSVKLPLTRKLTDRVVGTGDFNGDGRMDVLLRRANGRWLVYIIKGLDDPILGQPGITPRSAFVAEALADFSGDGRTDLLMRNRVNGNWKLFIMKGTKVVDSGPVALPKNLSVHLEAVADFSGDAKADTVLRKPNGAWLLFALDGYSIVTKGTLDISKNAGWLIVAVADYTGDGLADLLLRHEDGRWSMFGVDGTVPEVTSRGTPEMTNFTAWVPQEDCLRTDDENDVVLGHHISTSGAQSAGREALAQGLDMGSEGAADLAVSEPFLMLLNALGFTVTLTESDGAGDAGSGDTVEVASTPVAAHPTARAAAAPMQRIERRLRKIAVDPDQVQDEVNILEQEAIELADALMTNPSRSGNVVTYRPDPESTCAVESVVGFIEQLDSDILTQETCVDVLAEMSIVQTVESEDSGRIGFFFGAHEPLHVTYDPVTGTATNDLDAQREAALLLVDLLQPAQPVEIPDTLTGEVQTTVTMSSDTVFTTSVSVSRPIAVSATSDGQVIDFAVEERADIYSSTVNEDTGDITNSLNSPPLAISLPVEDNEDDTIIYPGEILVPPMTGAAALEEDGTLLSVTDASLGGLPITYDVNDQRALEVILADFDLVLDSEADTISLPRGLDAGISFLEVPGVASADAAGELNWDAPAGTRIRVHDFPATETEEAYAVLEILNGQFDVLGTGAFEESSLSMLSGLCYQSVSSEWQEVECPL